jgi:hypothetical protein
MCHFKKTHTVKPSKAILAFEGFFILQTKLYENTENSKITKPFIQTY